MIALLIAALCDDRIRLTEFRHTQLTDT